MFCYLGIKDPKYPTTVRTNKWSIRNCPFIYSSWSSIFHSFLRLGYCKIWQQKNHSTGFTFLQLCFNKHWNCYLPNSINVLPLLVWVYGKYVQYIDQYPGSWSGSGLPAVHNGSLSRHVEPGRIYRSRDWFRHDWE